MNLNADLDRISAERPDRVALAWPDEKTPGSERAMTYGELVRLAAKAAGAFRAAGIGKGDCVAILHRNDPAFIAAYFGLIRLGAVAVPVNFMIQNPEELKYILGHCGAKGVVTQKNLLRGIAAARAGLPDLVHVWVTDDAPEGTEAFWPSVESAGLVEVPEAADPNDTVMILYTSGTTGFPKGVMLTHANLVSNCEATAAKVGLGPDDVTLAALPMFHTFAWTACVLLPLKLGGKIVIAPSVAPPEPWLGMMGRHGVTFFGMVPQVYMLLCSAAAGYRDYVLKGGFFKSLQLCVSGAAPLSAQIHQAFKEAFGLDIIEGYGLTETSPVTTLNPLGAPKVGSVGKPIGGVSVRVADEDGRDLPAGEVGEILVKGPNVMKGYYKNPEATREAVSPEGWLKTGDVGMIDEDGYLHIRDRKKDMIIVKGLKVFPAQVEKTLLGHPAVKEAAVVGVPDQTGDETIKAFLVLREGAKADLPELLRFCRENFDSYKRPKEIEVLAELPKNAMQKTLKRVLRDRELAKRRPAAA